MATAGPVTYGGTTTTYLPLTSAFPSVNSCSSLFVDPESSGHFTIYAFDPGYALKAGGGPVCQPSEVIEWWEQGIGGTSTSDIGGYSMVCPSMYTTALSQAHGTLSALIACCPSSYDFVSLQSAPGPAQCRSIKPAGVVTYLSATTSNSYITTSTSVSTSYAVFGVQVNGYLFFPTSTSSSSSSASTGLGSNTTSNSRASSTSSSSTASFLTNTPTNTSSSDLSTGAKAGIGIGVALGLIGLLSLAAAFLLYRRRKALASDDDAMVMRPNVPAKSPVVRDVDPSIVGSGSGNSSSGGFNGSGYRPVKREERYEVADTHVRAEMP